MRPSFDRELFWPYALLPGPIAAPIAVKNGLPAGRRKGTRGLKRGWTPREPGRNQRILPAAVETDPVRHDAIRQALERVLSSSGFARNERLSGFLRFLVERHLEGRDSELKESVIADEVFGREADYDPKLDAIVRTEAVRLRARLEKYVPGRRQPGSLDYRPAEGRIPAGRAATAGRRARHRTSRRAGRNGLHALSRIRWAAGAVAALVFVAIAAAVVVDASRADRR